MIYAIILLVIPIFLAWKYRKLLTARLELDGTKREAAIHAKLNKENAVIDKEKNEAYDEVDNINEDDMLKWLQDQNKKNKGGN